MTKSPSPPRRRRFNLGNVLIVGNYCHDVLIQNDTVVAQTLGGAASFISNVFNGLSISFDLTSKVGHDFKYAVTKTPIVVPSSRTTLFEAYFDKGNEEKGRPDRVLKRVAACDPIFPSDLTFDQFGFGLAVGVGGEITLETLEKMVEICDVVFVDIQALIRSFDSDDGIVKLVPLKDSGFYHLLPKIGFLKASSEEALFMDVEEVRRWCVVVVTNGKEGCKVFCKDAEMEIKPFSANEVDPTGAGDSFLGGFVVGLVEGLAVPDAALLGNFFGSIAVGQIGLPKFDLRMLQRVKEEIQHRKTQLATISGEPRDNGLRFAEPSGHEQFHAALNAARLLTPQCIIEDCQWDPPKSPRAAALQPNLLISPIFEEPIQRVSGKNETG